MGRAPQPTDDAAKLAGQHLLSLQRPDGCWEGEVVWCPVILAQAVIVRQLTGRAPDSDEGAGIRRHFERTRTEAGGWGIHPESPATVFVTTLSYIALRMLGVEAQDPLVLPAGRWLRAQPGGVAAIPTWGKLWLAFLGLYEYGAIHPCPPESFLLPKRLPFHPSRFYCHTRSIYTAMAFLYGSRFRAELGPLGGDLRRELYGEPPARLESAGRNAIAASDLYAQPGRLLRMLSGLLAAAERVVPRGLRRRALAHCLDRIAYEQRATRFQALSPVNGVLDCLALASVEPPHADLPASLDGLESWKWNDSQRGVRYAGARSNAWDTALAMQALLAGTDESADVRRSVASAYVYLRDTQMTEELVDREAHARDSILGGWCFSDGTHRWPVADCTAEAVSALLAAHERPELLEGVRRISPERLRLAAEFILDRQNDDGGFATYERRRGPKWLESFNPSEMFGNCMTEGSYVECTGSCLDALAHYLVAQPGVGLLEARVRKAIGRGERFLRAAQRPDGAFPAAWGIQFTYAAFFAVRGLKAAGATPADPALQAAARWLRQRQKSDGGWGEHYRGCLTDEYAEHTESQATMTSWASLALAQIEPDSDSIRRGIQWLASRQRQDGSWPEGAVNGVFFKTAMLDYRLYRAYFPLWALALASPRSSAAAPEER